MSWDKLNLFGVSNKAVQSTKQRNKRRPIGEPLVVDISKNKELAKLQLYGSTFAFFNCYTTFWFVILI